MNITILIADDEPNQLELMAYNLRNAQVFYNQSKRWQKRITIN